jgi:hypothetical protein
MVLLLILIIEAITIAIEFKAARLQIHVNFHKIFENVFTSKIL